MQSSALFVTRDSSSLEYKNFLWEYPEANSNTLGFRHGVVEVFELLGCARNVL
jgi:hypothetical protein